MADTLNYNDVKGWEVKQVDSKITELRKEMFSLRMQKVAAGIEKPHRLKSIKKDIARLMTAKNAKK